MSQWNSENGKWKCRKLVWYARHSGEGKRCSADRIDRLLRRGTRQGFSVAGYWRVSTPVLRVSFFFRRPAHAKWNGIVKGSLPRFLLPISACRMRRVRTSGTATSRTECRSSAAKSKFFFFVATKMGKEVFSPLAGVNPPHWFPFALTTKFDPWKSRLSLSLLSIVLCYYKVWFLLYNGETNFRSVKRKKELLLFFSRNLYIR